MRASLTIARHELRLLRRDPLPVAVLAAMPLILMAFTQPTYRQVLEAEGRVGVTGAEQAVPGMTVMFTLFLVAQVGFAFFRDHGWGTWERLRAAPISPAALLVGKAAAPMAICTAQAGLLFALGGLFFGLQVRGSALALAALVGAYAACLVLLGLALVSLCRTVMQLNSAASILALALAGLGGALVPISSLPAWARWLAPATPSYWAMRGFSAVILDGADLTGVAAPLAGLLLSALALGLVVALRFRIDQSKVWWP